MAINHIKHLHSYKTVLKSFCRWTSVRGLQHLVRSEHPALRLIWAVFVSFMFIANVVLITLLLIHYYQFNTIENIRTMKGIEVEFPHVTLCNVDPVNSHQIYCLKNPKAKHCNINRKYTDILNEYKKANNYFNEYKDSNIWHKLEDPSMVAIFYQLIGMEAASAIGHQINDFIIPIFCEITTLEKGGILLKRKCTDAGVLPINIITYKYFNCYTLSITDPAIRSNAVRLSAILYLDEEEDLNCRPYCTHEFTEWVGGKVVVHSIGTYPEIEYSSMNLLPGASNQILIDEVRRIEKKNMQSKPCENNEKTLTIVYFDIKQEKFLTHLIKYTESLCVQLMSQSATMDQCHCIDFLMPIPGNKMHLVNQLPFCGNLSRAKVNESLECSQQVRQKNSKKFRVMCPISCVQIQYNYELTQLRWPMKPRILNYYFQLKDSMDYTDKFRIYDKIEKLTRINATLALTMLQNTDVFEKNFLHLDVNRPNYDTLVVYRENEEYTLPTLLSQIGGICSIFLSFTCVTVLELIELVFRLISIGCPGFVIFLNSIFKYCFSNKNNTFDENLKSNLNNKYLPELTKYRLVNDRNQSIYEQLKLNNCLNKTNQIVLKNNLNEKHSFVTDCLNDKQNLIFKHLNKNLSDLDKSTNRIKNECKKINYEFEFKVKMHRSISMP